MPTAIELSEIGMINDMKLLDAISHNLANANTPGYKRDIAMTVGFDNILANEMDGMASDVVSGARHAAPSLRFLVDHASGALTQTGNPMDLAIDGAGYFEIVTDSGVRYSRSGNFLIDNAGKLVDSQGFGVAGLEGEILLSGGDITIERDGSVLENGEYAGQLKLVAFEDPSMLIKEGQGLLRPSDAARQMPDDDSGVRQGYREASNVQVMHEMVQLMTTIRHFETTSRVVKGYDSMIATAISTIAEF